MAKRRGVALTYEQREELTDSAELMSGILRPRQCRLDDLGRWWCPVCDEGGDCRSNFDSEADREAAYWALRDDVVADAWPGQRPWSWWRYEAPGVCDHRPPCPLPDLARRDDAERQWLDDHGVLTARERAQLARQEQARRAAADDDAADDDDGEGEE